MKILAVADEESKYLWEYYEPSKLRDIDLIIGCGDLSLHYMNFLSDAAPVPVLYVHGNHDANYDKEPPRGAICIDDDLYWYKGYRIVGLGGSCRYRAGAWQFTEAEMKRRISHLRSRIQRAGGVDILVTHAPLHGYGDFSDLPHRGFTVFNEILDTYHPALMLHGHIHLTYGANIPREHQYGQTRIVNCYERFTLDLPDKPDPRRHSLIERWKPGEPRWHACWQETAVTLPCGAPCPMN